MIQILKVTGESLSPFFLRGDYVIILKSAYFLRRLKQGDVVVFRHPGYGVLIKLVESLSPDGKEISVVGARPESADSRVFGPIPRRWLTGKVIARISNPNFQRN